MTHVDGAALGVDEVVGERTVVGVAILDAHREVVGEGVLDAAADRVADAGVAELVGRAGEAVHVGVAQVAEGGTTGGIEQGAVDGEAEAAADRALDRLARVVSDAADVVGRAIVRAVHVTFDTEHAAGATDTADQRSEENAPVRLESTGIDCVENR